MNFVVLLMVNAYDCCIVVMEKMTVMTAAMKWTTAPHLVNTMEEDAHVQFWFLCSEPPTIAFISIVIIALPESRSGNIVLRSWLAPIKTCLHEVCATASFRWRTHSLTHGNCFHQNYQDNDIYRRDPRMQFPLLHINSFKLSYNREWLYSH